MGGHVFGSEPIQKDNIGPTIKHFLSEFFRVFPNTRGHFETMRTLGSTGKADVSGDIDLAVDEKCFKNIEDWDLEPEEIQKYVDKFSKTARTASKQSILKKAIIYAIGDKLEAESSTIKVPDSTDRKGKTARLSGAGNGVLFCYAQQYGKDGRPILNKGVQIDVNFGDLEWLSFANYSEGSREPNVKGLHRTQLILHLFTNKGFSFSHNRGIAKDGKVVTRDPAEARKILSDLYGVVFTPEVFNSYRSLQEFLRKNLDSDELHKVWDIYLKTLDSTRCDIPSDLENYWLDNQDRLGLTGKFLPSSSKLYPFRSE